MTDILTPVGRLVGGSVSKPKTTDYDGNPLVTKTGPNAGQPRQDYSFGVAFTKGDPAVETMLATIHATAAEAWPGGESRRPGFATKITDGDSTELNKAGRRPCDHEGYPGHWVLWFSSGQAPTLYTPGGKETIPLAEGIHLGYYVRVFGSVVGNANARNPGMYLNHRFVERVAFGEVIQVGPDAASVFAAPVTSLPAGARTTPAAPASAPPMTPAAPPPPPAPAGPVRRRHPSGMVYTEEQLRASGWSAAAINSLPAEG
jgi:hypothetical protein